MKNAYKGFATINFTLQLNCRHEMSFALKFGPRILSTLHLSVQFGKRFTLYSNTGMVSSVNDLKTYFNFENTIFYLFFASNAIYEPI